MRPYLMMVYMFIAALLGSLISSMWLMGEINDAQYRYIQLSLQCHEELIWTVRQHCYARVTNNKITRHAYYWWIVPKINELKREKAKNALVTDIGAWEEQRAKEIKSRK